MRDETVFILFVILLCFVMIATSIIVDIKKESNEPKWYPQRCEMCGAEYDVMPVHGGEVPPTVKWCFRDGAYCEKGIDFIVKNGEGEDESLNKEFVEHCFECVGCRCAAFKPQQWEKIKKGVE